MPIYTFSKPVEAKSADDVKKAINAVTVEASDDGKIPTGKGLAQLWDQNDMTYGPVNRKKVIAKITYKDNSGDFRTFNLPHSPMVEALKLETAKIKHATGKNATAAELEKGTDKFIDDVYKALEDPKKGNGEFKRALLVVRGERAKEILDLETKTPIFSKPVGGTEANPVYSRNGISLKDLKEMVTEGTNAAKGVELTDVENIGLSTDSGLPERVLVQAEGINTSWNIQETGSKDIKDLGIKDANVAAPIGKVYGA